MLNECIKNKDKHLYNIQYKNNAKCIPFFNNIALDTADLILVRHIRTGGIYRI